MCKKRLFIETASIFLERDAFYEERHEDTCVKEIPSLTSVSFFNKHIGSYRFNFFDEITS